MCFLRTCLCNAVRAAGGTRNGWSETAALGELLDFLEHERRLVAGAGVFMPTTHLRHGGIAFGGGRIPVQALPFRSQQLAERVPRRQAHADPERSQLLDRRDAQVLWLTDTHRVGEDTVRCAGAASRREPAASRDLLSRLPPVPTLLIHPKEAPMALFRR